MSEEDDDERRIREQIAEDRRKGRLIRSAQLRIGKALNRIWLGNAGGAVVSIGYLGAPHGGRAAWSPLGCFLLGLILLGGRELYVLLGLREEIRRDQHARSWIERKAGYAKPALERSGLVLDPGTVAAIIAAICFMIGCILGFLSAITG
jgi:hypothetical protein